MFEAVDKPSTGKTASPRLCHQLASFCAVNGGSAQRSPSSPNVTVPEFVNGHRFCLHTRWKNVIQFLRFWAQSTHAAEQQSKQTAVNEGVSVLPHGMAELPEHKLRED